MENQHPHWRQQTQKNAKTQEVPYIIDKNLEAYFHVYGYSFIITLSHITTFFYL